MTEPRVSKHDEAPALPADSTPQQRMAAWVDLMSMEERFLLTGLRRAIGPDGDLKAAYRQWYEQHMRERDEQRLRSMRRGQTHAA